MNSFDIEGTSIVETEVEGVTEYAIDNIRIYRVGVEGFPGHVTNAYLILDGTLTLIDPGSDGEKARADLDNGLRTIKEHFSQDIGFADIAGIIVTHAHGDHFRMLSNPKLKGNKVYIHQLDDWAVKDPQDLHTFVKRRIGEMIEDSGCDLNLDHLFSLDMIEPIEANDYDLIGVADGDVIVNGYQVCHTPGHSPGHICLRVGPVLFLGDHILSSTTPHQIPSMGQQGWGLQNYLNSLRKVKNIPAQIGLPAHEETIHSIRDRADQMEAFHYQRLEELFHLCTEEKNLYQLTSEYYWRHPEFVRDSGFERLTRDEKVLALEEMKAHLEYLMESKRMAVDRADNGVVTYRSI